MPLISPGVSVTISDNSLFIPAAASTVPLFFVASADDKLQENGSPATGTMEYGVVRTITSLKQSLELYGIPKFLEDTQGRPYHGDARNEYGLLALNQYLGIGNLAYVVRANVNLNDDISSIRSAWLSEMTDSALDLEGLITSFIDEYNISHGYIPSNINYKTAVTSSELISLANQVTSPVWDKFSFRNLKDDFFDDNTAPGAATSGYQTINLGGSLAVGINDLTFATVVTSLTASGLANNATAYNMTITVDGIPIAISIQGQNAQTFGSLLTQLNAQLLTAATASIVGGKVRITSATSGATSTVAVVDTNLLLSLTPAFVSQLQANGNSGNHLTGLNALTTYNMTVTANGVPQVVQVLGSTAVDFNSLISEIQTDVGVGVVVSISGGNLLITSTTTGSTSTITIVNGATNGLVTAISATLLASVPGSNGDLLMPVYENGYDLATTGNFYGLAGMIANCVTQLFCPTIANQFTSAEGRDVLEEAADLFQFTVEFKNLTALGANDAARRVAIVEALSAAINSNLDVRAENYEYNLLLCPGYHEVADELVNLSVDVKEEVMVVADTPMNMNPDDVVIWADTNSQRQRGTNVAYYYPHSYMSNLDGKTVLGAASGTAVRTITYSDSISEVWFAPAGTRRGRVSGVVQVGYVTGVLGTPTTFTEAPLSEGQRDNMYKYFTNLNPIAFIPGRGILVFGQKTSAADASARDRINVERMLMYVRRQLRKNALGFVFEPNDSATRSNLKAMVDGFLNDIVTKRGLYDFVSVCDESNNTPDRIDRNEMYIEIALKPTKAAEFIYIPISVVATGAEL